MDTGLAVAGTPSPQTKEGTRELREHDQKKGWEWQQQETKRRRLQGWQQLEPLQMKEGTGELRGHSQKQRQGQQEAERRMLWGPQQQEDLNIYIYNF